MIRCLLVDDEIPARKGLRALISENPGFEVVGEAADGDAAEAAILRLTPDLVFLDVEMPGRNGLDVIEAIGPECMPPIVMVTAYDRYAVAAFEAAAVDYLLKPFTDARLRQALERARIRLGETLPAQGSPRLRQMLRAVGRAPQAIQRFTVKHGDRISVFSVDDIDWIEADQYYAKIHIGDEVHMIRQTMTVLEDALPADRFVRIHRSTIVNLERVVALEPLFQGDHTVVLRDGTRLKMSRRRKELLNDILRPLG